MDQLLVEKYRPKKFEDIIGLPSEVPQLVEGGMSHFLFLGPPGTGKTTTARVISKITGYDILELNASDERGINTVREKIKPFAQTQSTTGKPKIIFLDEADHTTIDFQTSLRNLMEKYADNCRFILTCNYPNKIIDALKSRMTCIEFRQPDKDEIITRLTNIASKEDVSASLDMCYKIMNTYYPDIRSMVNAISVLKRGGDPTKNIGIGYIQELWITVKKSQFLTARQLLLDNCYDHDALCKALYESVMYDKELNGHQKADCIHSIADCLRWINNVAFPEIQVESMLLKLMQKVKT